MTFLMTLPQTNPIAPIAPGTAAAAGGAAANKNANLREVAKQFEAAMLAQLTAALRPAAGQDENNLFGNGDGGVPQQMFGEQLANAMANGGGIGLADMLVRQLDPKHNLPGAGSPHVERTAATARELRAAPAAQTASPGAPAPSAPTPSAPSAAPDSIEALQNVSRPRQLTGLEPRTSAATPSASPASDFVAALQNVTRPRRVTGLASAEASTASAAVKLPAEPQADSVKRAATKPAVAPASVDKPEAAPAPKEPRNFVVTGRKHFREMLATAKSSIAAAPATATLNIRTASAAHAASSRSTQAAGRANTVILNPSLQTPQVIPVIAASHNQPSGAVDMQVPLQGRISSQFGARRGRGRHHQGVDIAAPTGTPIEASASRQVVFSGWSRGYGKTVVIKHQDGLYTRYAHAQNLLVSPGDAVQAGQSVATVGSTGHATGPHLHFEVIQHDQSLNP